jgi:hypothetical protein
MDRAADYLVSYASADRAWAEWIAWQLEAEGYMVVVQAWTSPLVATGPMRCNMPPPRPNES